MVAIVNWILSGLVGLLVIMLGYVLKMLITKFDEMIKSINNLNKTLALQAQRLNQGDKEFRQIYDNMHGLNEDLTQHKKETTVRFEEIEDRVLEIEVFHKIEKNNR